jgi:hypothetical protein
MVTPKMRRIWKRHGTCRNNADVALSATSGSAIAGTTNSIVATRGAEVWMTTAVTAPTGTNIALNTAAADGSYIGRS